jgi:hypothetical protein
MRTLLPIPKAVGAEDGALGAAEKFAVSCLFPCLLCLHGCVRVWGVAPCMAVFLSGAWHYVHLLLQSARFQIQRHARQANARTQHRDHMPTSTYSIVPLLFGFSQLRLCAKNSRGHSGSQSDKSHLAARFKGIFLCSPDGQRFWKREKVANRVAKIFR